MRTRKTSCRVSPFVTNYPELQGIMTDEDNTFSFICSEDNIKRLMLLPSASLKIMFYIGFKNIEKIDNFKFDKQDLLDFCNLQKSGFDRGLKALWGISAIVPNNVSKTELWLNPFYFRVLTSKAKETTDAELDSMLER